MSSDIEKRGRIIKEIDELVKSRGKMLDVPQFPSFVIPSAA